MNVSAAVSESGDLSPIEEVIKNGIVGLNGPWLIGCQFSML
jgi:hypothetical protein